MKQREGVTIMKTVQDKPINMVDGEIALPDVKYVAVMEVSEEKVFKGRTFSMPLVLFEYLRQSELQVFYLIMRHLREHGCCFYRNKTLGEEISVTHVTVYLSIKRMASMGLLRLTKDGKRTFKFINWEAVQHLEEISKKWKPGALVYLRERMRDNDVMSIPPKLMREMKMRYEISDNPEENEEYD